MDIEKLADKVGSTGYTHFPNEGATEVGVKFTHKQLQAYTNAVIDECAKECNKVAWCHPNSRHLGAELNSLKCEELIRKLKVDTL